MTDKSKDELDGENIPADVYNVLMNKLQSFADWDKKYNLFEKNIGDYHYYYDENNKNDIAVTYGMFFNELGDDKATEEAVKLINDITNNPDKYKEESKPSITKLDRDFRDFITYQESDLLAELLNQDGTERYNYTVGMINNNQKAFGKPIKTQEDFVDYIGFLNEQGLIDSFTAGKFIDFTVHDYRKQSDPRYVNSKGEFAAPDDSNNLVAKPFEVMGYYGSEKKVASQSSFVDFENGVPATGSAADINFDNDKDVWHKFIKGEKLTDEQAEQVIARMYSQKINSRFDLALVNVVSDDRPYTVDQLSYVNALISQGADETAWTVDEVGNKLQKLVNDGKIGIEIATDILEEYANLTLKAEQAGIASEKGITTALIEADYATPDFNVAAPKIQAKGRSA